MEKKGVKINWLQTESKEDRIKEAIDLVSKNL